MRILIQRVKRASVTINGKIKSKIGTGLLILAGIEDADTPEDAKWLAKKASSLRIFDDENGIMNQSVKDIDGSILIISQFTLHASTKKGNRPSYIKAAKHELAIPIYEAFCHDIEQETSKSVSTGEFGANMQVELINDGPVTIWIDSKNKE
ncbi:D-aminoacyl-tRNA deacylase [Coprobacter sp.]